jgi:PadR family transcriptional regulator, regulatory protein PadR
MTKPRTTLLQGTLDMLVLRTLRSGARHGYAIARWLEERTRDALQIEEGSLYPALYRMERKGWIEAEWGVSELGKRVKLYSLTDAGHQQLSLEASQWKHFVSAVAAVMQGA